MTRKVENILAQHKISGLKFLLWPVLDLKIVQNLLSRLYYEKIKSASQHWCAEHDVFVLYIHHTIKEFNIGHGDKSVLKRDQSVIN